MAVTADRVQTSGVARLADRARELVADEVRLSRIATTVIAIAVADDAFVHPEPAVAAQSRTRQCGNLTLVREGAGQMTLT